MSFRICENNIMKGQISTRKLKVAQAALRPWIWHLPLSLYKVAWLGHPPQQS